VASEQDLEDLLGDIGSPRSLLPADPLERAFALLDRGRYTDARVALGQVLGGSELAAAVAWARLELGLGETREALDRLLAAALWQKRAPKRRWPRGGSCTWVERGTVSASTARP